MDGRVAVLASGGGTNLQALLDDPDIGAAIVLVVSDNADARALARARDRGVEAVHLDPAAFPDREGHDGALVDLLRDREIDVVALAGYMRLVGPVVVAAFRDRLVNVHPALLPSFPGTHAVADALAYGVKVTGVTVHLVDEGIDTGPVILQEAIEVRDDDDWDSLEARVHAVEHRLLPRAVRAALTGRLTRDGRHVRVEEDAG
jgi:phosphoribosylglycinamide formyltransferase-1